MQALRQQKQQYLRQNILQKNYDAEQFMDYCQSSTGSVDIDQWSFMKLVQIVQDFIKSKNINNKPTNNTNFQIKPIGISSTNQFEDWGNYIQQLPVKKQETKFELNAFDWDFLENLSGNSTPTTAKQVNTNSNLNKNPNSNTNTNISLDMNSLYNVSPKKVEPVKTQPNQNFMNVPSEIVKKLQQGNDTFVVGYNPATLPVQPVQKPLNVPSPKIQQHPRHESPPYKPQNQQKKISPPSQSYTSNPNSLSISQTSSQNFSKKINCKKLINKSKLIGNEQVVISGHQIINPNVFVPKYVMYFVTVNPNNIEVKRRLKDFESLRQLLQKFFPTTQIPHLQRCSRLSETQPAIIKKQILFLQSFLNSLLNKKQLKCKLLQQFLLCRDLDLLKKIFKQYEKLSGPRALEGLFSPSGQLQLKMSPENRRYVNQHIGLNQFLQQHFTKIKSLYDTLVQGFEHNTKTLNQIQQQHKLVKQKIKSINSQFTPQYQCPQLQKSIERVEMMHKQWASSFKTQVRIIQSELRHLYRYQQTNITTLKQLLKFQQQIASAYAKRSDKQAANRQTYQSRKLQQYKLSIQTPSKNITVLKHQAAYMQQKLSQQCLGYLTQFSTKLDNKYKLFCTLEYSICQDMQSVWKSFQNYYK